MLLYRVMFENEHQGTGLDNLFVESTVITFKTGNERNHPINIFSPGNNRCFTACLLQIPFYVNVLPGGAITVVSED